MIHTTCPFPRCRRPLESVDISTDMLNEVTVSWSCGKHSDRDTWQVPSKLNPVVPVRPDGGLGTSFGVARMHRGPVARR